MTKLSVYVRDDELLNNIKLLAYYDEISLTALVSKILMAYTQERKQDLDFLHSQIEEIKMHKNNSARAHCTV